MKAIIPEVYVKDCMNALDLYISAFGGEIKNLQISDNMEMFKKYKGKVIHSELHVNSRCVFYFVDMLDKKRAGNNITLVVHTHTRSELEKIFAALADGGKINMPPQKTLWGEYHARLIDKFGTSWALNFAPRKSPPA